MIRPIIAWLSDFGTRDHYVAAMKGVALGICREATLVDITHDVPPQDILAGALELAAAYRYFPPGTIFVAVVDPGVGSERRGIAVSAGAYVFVAPDNGLLTLVLDEVAAREAIELTNPRYQLPEVSRTFEGRDRFAPAAAFLATGIEPAALGGPLDAAGLVRLNAPAAIVAGHEVVGEVMRVDRFGNLVTNITAPAAAALAGDAQLVVTAGTHRWIALVTTYAEARPGGPCALFGSSGHLEIAVNGRSAADALALGRGAPVRLSRRA